MKKTLVLSMMLCGSVSLLLSGCGGKDAVGNDSTSATTANTEVGETGDMTGDGDPTTTGDGDGDASTTSDPTTTAGVFVPDDDIGGVSECDPFMQDCPDGEKCVPYGSTGGNWDANKCVPVTGGGAAGDQCTYGGVVEATDDCDAGTHCWDVMDVDGQQVGVCTEFCTGTADNPICARRAPRARSPTTARSTSASRTAIRCFRTATRASPASGPTATSTASSRRQDIPTGEPCGFINDCVAGNICQDATVLPACNGAACCASYCCDLRPDLPGHGYRVRRRSSRKAWRLPDTRTSGSASSRAPEPRLSSRTKPPLGVAFFV